MVTTTEDADAAVAALAASGVSSLAARARDSGSTRPLANAAAAPRTPRESRAGLRASSRTRRRHSSREETPLSRRETPRTVASSRGCETRPRTSVSGGSSRNAEVPGTGTAGTETTGTGTTGTGTRLPGMELQGMTGTAGTETTGTGMTLPGPMKVPGARAPGGSASVVRASSSLAGPLGANARDSAGVGREPAALKLVGDLALESEASRAVRDAEVAELALLRGEEAADSHRGFRLFRDVALRGRTLRLAKPVGGVTRVPRRGVVSLRYLELREVPESVHLGGYLGRVGKVGVVGTRRKVPSGKREMRSPHLLPAARAERGGHHAPLQSLHLRGVFDAKFCRLAELRVTKRLASRVERATHLRLRHANCCPPRRQSRVLFLEAAARVGLQIINSRTRVFKSPRFHLIVQLCMAPLHQPARPFLAKCASR